jgi:hypothetical protein
VRVSESLSESTVVVSSVSVSTCVTKTLCAALGAPAGVCVRRACACACV